jgi:HEAT repeat protein
MDEPVENSLRIRPVFLLWFLAVVGWLLIVAGFVLWWGLPRWEPDLVVEESPWLGPAFEAAVHDSAIEHKFRDRLPEWGDQVVPFMCSVAASGGDLKRRRLALSTLSEFTDPREIPYLVPLLRDPDDTIVQHTLYALWGHKDRDLAQPLLDALPHLSPDRAAQAAGILAHIPDSVPFEAVSTTLLAARRTDLQALGCVVLIGSTDPRTLQALLERLGRFTTDRTDWAGYALGESQLPGVTAAIATALADPDPQRRRGAVIAVQWRQDHPEHATLLEPLLQLSRESGADIQQQVLRALAGFPNDTAVAALRTAIEAGGPLAITAVDNLDRNRAPSAKPTMVACLGHPEVAVRKRLLSRLRYQTLPADIDKRAILALLYDQDTEVVKLVKQLAKDLKLTPDEQRELDAVGK